MTRQVFSVSVYAVHEGRVLLGHHKRLGLWLPIGGEVAAYRELLEETGLEGDPWPDTQPVFAGPQGMLYYEEHPAGSKGIHLNFVFLFRVSSGEAKRSDEHEAFVWCAKEDRAIRESVPVNVAVALSKVFQRIGA